MVYSHYSVTAIIVSVVLPILAAAAVAARLKSRKLKALSLQADDYLILLALIIAIAEGIFCIWGSVDAGIGANIHDLSRPISVKLHKALFAVILIHLTVLTTIKLSILLFYKRIFQTPRFYLAANITMGLVICWWITFFIGPFFVTSPLSDFWSKRVPVFNYDWAVFVEVLAALDIAADVLILCLPIPMIRKLHIETKRKFQLTGIFWLGLFCVVSAAVRMYYVVSFNNIGGPASPQITGVIDNNFIWAEIEPCTSIIAACLPTIGPLLQSWRTPESIVNSVRSVFSIRSGGSVYRTNDAPPSNKGVPEPETNPSLERAWLKLGEGGVNEAGATFSSRNPDIELGVLSPKAQQNSSAIVVEKSFATKHSPR